MNETIPSDSTNKSIEVEQDVTADVPYHRGLKVSGLVSSMSESKFAATKEMSSSFERKINKGEWLHVQGIKNYVDEILTQPNGREDLSSPDLQVAACRTITMSEANPDLPYHVREISEFIRYIEEVKQLFSIPEEVFQDTLKRTLEIELKEGLWSRAQQLVTHFNIPQETLQSPELRDAALDIIKNKVSVHGGLTYSLFDNWAGSEAIYKAFSPTSHSTAPRQRFPEVLNSTLQMMLVLKRTFGISDEEFKKVIRERVEEANLDTLRREEVDALRELLASV